MAELKDMYNEKGCKPKQGAVVGADSLMYELRYTNINCIDCNKCTIIGGVEFCKKANDLEKKAEGA